jgi:hypothetical protein
MYIYVHEGVNVNVSHTNCGIFNCGIFPNSSVKISNKLNEPSR